MKKIILGYIFNESSPKKDEKLFFELAKKKNINLTMINSSKNLTEEELKKKIDGCKLFYNNGGDVFSLELAKTLEELGAKIIESPDVFYYDEDKWMFFVKCDEHGIPTPKTILLSENLAIARKEIKDFNCWPIVLKRIDGALGEYVEKADNLTQVEKIINRFWKKGSERLPIIAQELIHSPSYRITVVGNKVVQTAIKESKHWKATGTYTNHFKTFKIDDELKKILKKINNAFKMKIYGVDLFKLDGKWLLCEINAQPGLDFFEKERKKLIGEILDFMKKQAK